MALTAVAFQDHLIRSLSLSDPLRPKRFPGMGKTKTWKKEIRAVVDTGRGLLHSELFCAPVVTSSGMLLIS